ncbi:MAG: hypothetical protein NTY30_05085 [Candidatus Berkelbacteria bacterium]|nr:hypothetical protein [Candidatus Berkelbacteria bacterium]
MSEKVLHGTVTLHRGTGAKYDSRLTIEMITTEIGRITSADAGKISETLVGRLIYLKPGVIYLEPENASWNDEFSP